MEISISTHSDRLFYQITRCDPDLESVLAHNGYTKREHEYFKSFPLPFPYAETIARNFLRDAERMFREEASSGPMKWQEGLAQFAAMAKQANLDWWTTGKISLALLGADVPIDDVDFYFHADDFQAVYDVFHEYIVEPLTDTEGTWRADSFQYCGVAYCACPICLFVAPRASLDIPEPVHFGPFAAEHLETVQWNGYEIKIPPIDLYIRTLERWGNTERARAVREALGRGE